MPGSEHGPSILCPDIYDALRRQGMDKTKSARISNAACKKRKKKRGFAEPSMELEAQELRDAEEELRLVWEELYPGEEFPDLLAAEDDPELEAEPLAASEERPGRDYLAAMVGWFKKTFGNDFDEDEYRKAHRTAMSKAGGKATARRRAEAKLQASEVHNHVVEHPEPVQGCEMCGSVYSQEPVLKMPKGDARARYREADLEVEGEDADLKACGKCRFYKWGSCNLVEGTIEADDVCNLFLPKPLTYLPEPSIYTAADGEDFRLFVEQSFAEAPEWVNIIPKSGVYSHPKYGKIVLDKARAERFVKNFDDRVYQQDVPITLDAEHDGKWSGAMGYYEELRVNEDGSVDAKVKWTERGRTLVEGEQFRYFSPEWHELWRDPATLQVHQDVLVGGAITTRPFFKESALRPLVASEGSIFAPEGSGPEYELREIPAVVEESELMTVQMTEEEVADLRAAAARFAEAEARATRLEEDLTAVKNENRRKRFTDVVMGRGEGGDGAVWIGPIEDNVQALEAMADAIGEDSEGFKRFVETQTGVAKQLKENPSFRPIGTSEPVENQQEGADAEVDRLATKMVEERKVTYAEAVQQVFAENPALFRQHRRASRFVGRSDEE